MDIGAHVGSFSVLCHHYWPAAKIVAVEPYPDSFGLLVRNTAHIPADQLLLINAAVTKQSGKALLSSPVSHSRVSEYVPEVWDESQPRHRDFGIEVPAITVKDLWRRIVEFRITDVDLLKLDSEGAEYLILPELSRLGLLQQAGWIRGEWHSKVNNCVISQSLTHTHSFHIDPNEPHDVGLFIGHKK